MNYHPKEIIMTTEPNAFIEAAKTAAANPQLASSSLLGFFSAMVMLVSLVILLSSMMISLKTLNNPENTTGSTTITLSFKTELFLVGSLITLFFSGNYFLTNF